MHARDDNKRHADSRFNPKRALDERIDHHQLIDDLGGQFLRCALCACGWPEALVVGVKALSRQIQYCRRSTVVVDGVVAGTVPCAVAERRG